LEIIWGWDFISVIFLFSPSKRMRIVVIYVLCIYSTPPNFCLCVLIIFFYLIFIFAILFYFFMICNLRAHSFPIIFYYLKVFLIFLTYLIFQLNKLHQETEKNKKIQNKIVLELHNQNNSDYCSYPVYKILPLLLIHYYIVYISL